MSADTTKLFSELVSTVRASTALSARDVDFCRSLDTDVAASIDTNAAELIDMINDILVSIDPHCDQLELGREKLEDSWNDFSNLMDTLFEKSDRSLDLLGKRTTAIQENRTLQYLDDSSDRDSNPSARILKPQLQFETPVDNSESHPFAPLLVEKPHSSKPLSESLQLIPKEENIPEHYPQPYEYEIDHQEYGSSVLLKTDPIPSKPWNGTEAIWVDNVECLHSMLLDLKNYKEIAVDLEHHDYRSYYGIVCLMQISTRDTDYLIDTICLREKLKPLNEIFADPNILKVFHGAFMDIIWLQRDLGLYVVSLFDTYHASRAIGLPRFSLAYLLERYANFKTSKKYQLADWRIRPLSNAMRAYARSDTHFLLNIYDQLRNKLVEDNKLAGVLFESRNVAKRRFEYTRYRPRIPISSVYSSAEKSDAWRLLMYQYNIQPEKELLLKKIYEWRDMIARRDDESPRYVMPNQLLVTLVSQAPGDSIGVISVSNMVTDHVRSNSKDLANLIRKTAILPSNNTIQNTSESRNFSAKLDEVEIFTVPQIKQKVSQFKKLLRDHESKISLKSSEQSKILLGDILSRKPVAVSFLNDQNDQVSINQLKTRSSRVLKRMKSFDDQATHSVSIIVSSENLADAKELSNRKASVEKPSSSAETDIDTPKSQEDMDEIVSLSRVRNRGKGRVSDPLSKNSSKDVIDYTKNDKILQKNGSQRSRNPKKRTFDPYSASNASSQAPTAPKRRRQAHRGKSASFKK